MEKSNSSSFSTFQRNVPATSSNTSTHSRSSEPCRRKLNYNEENSNETDDVKAADKSILSRISLNDTRKVLRNGLDRINKTFNNVRTSVGSFTQMFKTSTKRRQILEEGPMTPSCMSPDSRAQKVLGRTPTKLYSPFGIESPYRKTTCDKENIPRPTAMEKISKKNGTND
ncbi:uncharacterized protein LOC123320125 [Coccinella septempunctata]|uniref:uncharacterized protein LOC123320125 n=1 Tax=Coccinella septempunctata TaxID=41139 RepID=UPI001D06A4D4|nr:uncharacterized protein LOC123320125 [Coccinella septempunctata]